MSNDSDPYAATWRQVLGPLRPRCAYPKCTRPPDWERVFPPTPYVDMLGNQAMTNGAALPYCGLHREIVPEFRAEATERTAPLMWRCVT